MHLDRALLVIAACVALSATGCPGPDPEEAASKGGGTSQSATTTSSSHAGGGPHAGGGGNATQSATSTTETSTGTQGHHVGGGGGQSAEGGGGEMQQGGGGQMQQGGGGSGGAPDLCMGGVVCQPLDACHVAGMCNPSTGHCSNPKAADGKHCDDGDACTQADSCQNGVCVGFDPVICQASDTCHKVGVCDSLTGGCSNPAKADGALCDDGDACTLGDVCESGTCLPGMPADCGPIDGCHLKGSCNPSTGDCTTPQASDGTPCDDGDLCTQVDTCVSGVCTGFQPVECGIQGTCHTLGTCDPGTGTCSNPVAANGTPCPCGTCGGGTCVATLLGGTSIGPGTAQTDSLFVAGNSVYFANLYAGFGGLASVGFLPATGGVVTPLATNLTNASNAVVIGSNLYFSDNSGIWQVPIDGSAQAVVIAGAEGIGGMATDGTFLYATSPGDATVTGYMVPGAVITTSVNSAISPGAVVADSVNVYWADGTPGIEQTNVMSGGTTNIESGIPAVSLALDAANVYYVDGSTTFGYVPIGGGSGTIVSTSLSAPRAITVVGGTAYVAAYGNGSSGNIVTVNIATGQVTPIPNSTSGAPVAITHDGQCIYWADVGSGSIWSAPQ